jgi:hypothetical protein
MEENLGSSGFNVGTAEGFSERKPMIFRRLQDTRSHKNLSSSRFLFKRESSKENCRCTAAQGPQCRLSKSIEHEKWPTQAMLFSRQPHLRSSDDATRDPPSAVRPEFSAEEALIGCFAACRFWFNECRRGCLAHRSAGRRDFFGSFLGHKKGTWGKDYWQYYLYLTTENPEEPKFIRRSNNGTRMYCLPLFSRIY